MPEVIVNVFEGTDEQVPNTFKVNADIYQDIVTNLIRAGIDSGQIYGINGEIIDYKSKVTLPEVNYIIATGKKGHVSLKDWDGKTSIPAFLENGTIRDIYNYAVAQGYDKDDRLIFNGSEIPLDLPVKGMGLSTSSAFFILPSRTRPSRTILSRTIPAPQTVPAPQIQATRTIYIRTAAGGEKSFIINVGQTRANEIVQRATPNDFQGVFKLARVTRGSFIPYIYRDDEIINELGPDEHFYLVPDYETLFAGYSAMNI